MPKKNRNPKQYDIDPALVHLVKDLAKELRVTESQIVQFFIALRLTEVQEGSSEIWNCLVPLKSLNWNGDSFLEGYQITRREWCAVLRYYDNTCLSCGIRGEYTKLGKLTLDHVVPRSKSGAETIDNIQPLCWPCNYAKRDKAIDFRPHPLPDFVELARKFCPSKEVADGQKA